MTARHRPINRDAAYGVSFEFCAARLSLLEAMTSATMTKNRRLFNTSFRPVSGVMLPCAHTPFAASGETPILRPRSIASRSQRDETVHREAGRHRFGLSEEHRKQPRQVREVSDKQDVACFSDESVSNPSRGVAGLQVARRVELPQRITRAPEDF